MNGPPLYLLLCMTLLWSCDQAFVVPTQAWKFPFRRRRRPSTTPNTSTPSTPDSPAGGGGIATNNASPEGLAPLAALTSETQKVIQEIEEAIDQATRLSKTWFQRFITVPPFLQSFYDHFVALVLYKPPVGIVTLFTVTRLVVSGRLFRLYSRAKDPKASVEEALTKQRGEHKRAWLLDQDDVNYQTYGGIDRVRQQLVEAALKQAPESNLTKVLMQAVQLPSGSSRLDFLQQVAPLVAQIEASTGNEWLNSQPGSSFHNKIDIQFIAASAIQVRVMDALLRITRNRLLETTHRLGRTVSYWEKRVTSSPPWGLRRPRVLEQDRLRLAYAHAAYQQEINHLGQVVQLLLERPRDVPSDVLIKAYKQSKLRYQSEDALEHGSGIDEAEKVMLHTGSITQNERKRWSLFGARQRGGHVDIKTRMSLPSIFSKYYIRWRPEGKGLLSLRQAETIQGLHPEVTSHLMLQHDRDGSFVDKAMTWTVTSRQTICKLVQDSLEGSPSKPKYELSAGDFQRISDSWCQNQLTGEDSWKRLILYVNNLALWRRTGEGETIRLRDAALISWTKRLDIMGIPSTLLAIQVAFWIHAAVIPHWPQIRVSVVKAFLKALEILQQRVWTPFKGIYDEIMNKSKGMMSGFGLKLEEQTLDHLLRDLGFGDGTEGTRKLALQMAAEQYEHDLNSGVFVNIARGRLVRLLLIQIQQLKVGLLSALETIDVLMKGNQIHFQFLAAIPAFVLATFGTRFFLRFLYSIRSRDLRPVTVAHAKMGTYLSHMERLILFDNFSDDARLSAGTLGEICLYMYRYLMLLDYAAPVLPSAAATEQVHASLKAFFQTTQDRKSPNLSIQWLNLLRKQHDDLIQHG